MRAGPPRSQQQGALSQYSQVHSRTHSAGKRKRTLISTSASRLAHGAKRLAHGAKRPKRGLNEPTREQKETQKKNNPEVFQGQSSKQVNNDYLQTSKTL